MRYADNIEKTLRSRVRNPSDKILDGELSLKSSNIRVFGLVGSWRDAGRRLPFLTLPVDPSTKVKGEDWITRAFEEKASQSKSAMITILEGKQLQFLFPSLDHIIKHSSLVEGIEGTQNPLRDIKGKERQLLVEMEPVLQKFLHDKPKLQLHALYAAQVFCCNEEFPKGLLLRLSNGLYEEDVVDGRLTMCGGKMLMNSIVERGRHCFR
ncbi:eukaryotic translation initiation factor 4 gamma 2-like [Styela clava]